MSGAIHNCRIFLAIAGLAVIGTVSAQDIYKWQDQKGTTHYGEIPPPMEFSRFEVLDVRLEEPARPVAESYRSALELANNLQADRLEREKLRLEREKLLQQDRQARLEAQRYNDTYQSRYYNGGYYPYRSYSRPPHSGKPHPRPPRTHPPRASYPGTSVPKRVYLGR